MRIGIYGGNVRRGSSACRRLVDEIVRDGGGRAFRQLLVAAGGHVRRLHHAGARRPGHEPDRARHGGGAELSAPSERARAAGRDGERALRRSGWCSASGLRIAPGIEALGLAYDRPARHTREYVSDPEGARRRRAGRFRGRGVSACKHRLCLPEALAHYAVVVSALAPLMLKAAGEVADGTVTWMVGQAHHRRQHGSAHHRGCRQAAGREAPRVVVGLPVCVHDDKAQATARAVQIFQGYGHAAELPSPARCRGHRPGRRDRRGGQRGRRDARSLQAFFDAGATEVIASIYPAGDDSRGSFARTNALLKSLAAAG